MKRAQVAGFAFAFVAWFAVCPIASAWAQEAGEEEPKEEKKEEPSAMKTFLGYALSLGGLVVIAALVVHTASKNLRYPDARNGLIHLLRTNPYQAEEQCLMMPHSFYEPIGAALKTGGMTASDDPKMVATATVPTYEAIAGVVVQHWKGMVGKAKLATMASVGGLAIAATNGSWPILITLISLLSVSGLVWLFVFKADIERSIMRARVEVLPDVDRAVVEGRYRPPPPG